MTFKVFAAYIPRIEEALGFKLYEEQIRYLTEEVEDPRYDTLRGTGKTTVYCIKLALTYTYGPALDLNRPTSFSDAAYSGLTGSEAIRYSKSFFVREFMSIREKLSNYGFPVRSVLYPRRRTGGFKSEI